MDLVDKKCIPCSGGVPPLPEDEILKLKKEVSPELTTRLRHIITSIDGDGEQNTINNFVNNLRDPND